MAINKEVKDDTAKAVQMYFRAKTLENVQNFGLAPLAGIFAALEGGGSNEIAQAASSAMAKKHGLTFAEKSEIEQEAREDIQKAEEKLQTEYGKLSKAVLDAESNEERAYYNQLGKFATARASLGGKQISAELQAHKEQMADLETDDAMTDETKSMARSIRAAAKANSPKVADDAGEYVVDQDAYKAYVDKQVELVINDEGIEESQKEILIRNLRPSLPDDSPSLEILEGDTVQDSEEVVRQKAELRDEFRNRIRTKYGTGSSSMMRKAEERLQKASDKRIQALSDFQKKNPISKAFGGSETIKAATSQIEQVRALPERDFRSRQIATQLAQREDVQPFLQGAPSVRKGLKGLLSEYKSQQMATKRPKLPAPPSAVYGAETQVAVDEEPDGTNPTAA